MHFKERRLLVLYGSQTGQAKAISETVHQLCEAELNPKEHGLFLAHFSLDLVDKRFSLENEDTLVIIVSTTGEGEPPDNALKFWRRIKKRTLPANHLSHLNYCLLGLGDSNYNRFANFGRSLDHRFEELGAKKIFRTGFGDDAVGLELGVEPWIESLIPTLLAHFQLFETIMSSDILAGNIYAESKQNDDQDILSFSLNVSELKLPLITKKLDEIKVSAAIQKSENDDEWNVLLKLPTMDSEIIDAEVVSVRQLTSNDTTTEDRKIVLEACIKLKLSDNDLKYSAGDSFGFIAGNHDEEVKVVIDKLGLSDRSQESFSISCKGLDYLPKTASIWNYFKYYVELRWIPNKSCLRCFANFCSSAHEKQKLCELSSREGAELYQKFIREPSLTVIDILQIFKSCKPSLEAFFSYIPSIIPRYYSVVNTQTDSKPDHATIAFSVVELKHIVTRTSTQVKGLFTGHLHKVYNQKNDKLLNAMEALTLDDSTAFIQLKAFKRKNAYFKLPTSPDTNLILVGPGTGVAPFIGFLQERLNMKASGHQLGQVLLYFGCRHPELDFIYKEELEKKISQGILTKLSVSFSRYKKCADDSMSDSLKYVQDAISANTDELSKLLKLSKTYIFVCGDVKKLSVNVFNAFTKVVEEGSNQNREAAVKILRDMQEEKKYLQDVWL